MLDTENIDRYDTVEDFLKTQAEEAESLLSEVSNEIDDIIMYILESLLEKKHGEHCETNGK